MKNSSKIVPFIVGSSIIALSFYYFSSIWLYIILSAIISLIGRPLVHLLSRVKIGKIRINKGISAGISLMLFWTVLFLFLRFFLPLIASEAQELSKVNIVAIEEHFQSNIDSFQQFTEKIAIDKNDVKLKPYLQRKFKSILDLSHMKSFFSNLVGTIGNIFIAIFAISFISFFFLKDEKLLLNGLLTLAPESKVIQIRAMILKIVKLLSRYFTGLILEVSSIIFIVTVGLWIVGIDFSHAIVIGLVAGFLNVVPYVGPLIGMAFGSVIAIATELTEGVPDNLFPIFIGVIAIFLIAQLIDNFILQPLIYSNSVNATPLEIFLVILMAGTVGGISGMILAIPIYTILRVIAKETLSQFKMVEKLTKNI